MAQLDLIDRELAAAGAAEQTAADEGDQASRPGRKRDHTRDPEILQAALDVLAETGYDGMTIDMVASRAKAGKATLYRRWPSKAELVLDAVACMKQQPTDPAGLPDTGTLRGDLVAMIKTPSLHDAARKLQVMTGLVSMLARSPELADAARAVLVEPRARATRFLLERAVERGEVSPDADIDRIVYVSAAMITYRTLMLREPVTREYVISVIDGVVLPALGVGGGVSS